MLNDEMETEIYYTWMQVTDANEDLLPIPGTEIDQAKLVLELQKENRELRMHLACKQQKLVKLKAQSLAAYSSPTPPSASSFLSTPPTSVQPNEKRRAGRSFLTATYLTPENMNKGEEMAITIRKLYQKVKALESEIERMKKDHSLQIKHKDDIIRELSQKSGRKVAAPGEVGKRVVTRSSIRPKNENTGELKSPSYRFRSPLPMAKKRSFWDITAANSPSVAALNERKTRSHVISEPTANPSMLLQVCCFFSPNHYKAQTSLQTIVLHVRQVLDTNISGVCLRHSSNTPLTMSKNIYIYFRLRCISVTTWTRVKRMGRYLL
jgi:kinesin family protein 18/19